METWQIGDVVVTKVVEIEFVGALRATLPDLTPAAVAPFEWLKPHFVDERGELKMSIHALVVETPSHRIVVDTCLGNDKQGRGGRPQLENLHTSFLQDFRAAGFAPESIDIVLCTHLHVDHVGWNTMLVDGQWKPTFPKARYLFARTEFEHWRDQTHHQSQRSVFNDSIQPVVDSGLVDLVETDHQVCDEIRFVPTLGHSPGHVAIRISSRGQEALITGDFIHHPAQLALPEVPARDDHNPSLAVQTRINMIDAIADQPTLLIGTHFCRPTVGRVARDGKAFRLVI